jgi:hypothetical protein
VVHPHHAGDPDFRRRFAREVAVARQVGGFHTAAVVVPTPTRTPVDDPRQLRRHQARLKVA